MTSRAPLFPGLVGFDDSVLPALERGILAGHDLILLGERGQAKTRLVRALVQLLDEYTPAIEGTETNDHPYRPISAHGRSLVDEHGDATPLTWIHRDDRYAEKLATPDTSVGDLIGDVDPIKVAEGRYLGDEGTIHYGLIPRTNRGIVAINELPDLPERIQVSLFNILEERDVQIRGYRIRLAAGHAARRHREPRRLHAPRSHRLAAEGPIRHPDPHALPGDPARGDPHHGPGSRLDRRLGAPAGAALHEGGRCSADRRAAPLVST